VNVPPLPSLLLATMVPPCASAMLFAMNRPRPVPFRDFVANLLKRRGIMSGCIQVSVSCTESSIILLACSTDVVTVMVPSSVNFTALIIRFETIWLTLSLSAASGHP
jgi:hypothetical protein